MLTLCKFRLLLVNFGILSVLGNNLTCYQCNDCDKVDKNTGKSRGCPVCVKAIYSQPKRLVERSCYYSCEALPEFPAAKFYCCKKNLCNSSPSVSWNSMCFLSTVLIYIILKYLSKFM
uniref:UPAR/Ly6 domain-containing protein n=1 Tax=Trichobilharzia regenti TaxID=157069 RepID=A0AA85JVF9_TRIRE|nr:unnamed protein product [Trichobilharzia regenti]